MPERSVQGPAGCGEAPVREDAGAGAAGKRVRREWGSWGAGSRGAEGTVTADDTGAAIKQAADRIAALGESGPRLAPDPVNLPMIRHWVQAMGDTNPVYTDAEVAERSVHGGLVAPPEMTQVWTMRGLLPAGGDPAAREGLVGHEDLVGRED